MLLAAGTAATAEKEPTAVPVRIGQEAGQDACLSLGQVTLRRGGFLAVRSGPGVGYRLRDKLGPGQRLWLCDHRPGWHGVVYAVQRFDCGVGTPVASVQPYRGPCRQGWVSAAYVEAIAG